MNIIICLDNNGGLSFLNKRLSKDSAVINDIKYYLDGRKLYANCKSSILFADSGIQLEPITKFNITKDYSHYFAEDLDFRTSDYSVDEYIIYKWNRTYPSDVRFDDNLFKYNLIDIKEFIGSSHDRITRMVYKRIMEER